MNNENDRNITNSVVNHDHNSIFIIMGSDKSLDQILNTMILPMKHIKYGKITVLKRAMKLSFGNTINSNFFVLDILRNICFANI